jgi:hypothetical protein
VQQEVMLQPARTNKRAAQQEAARQPDGVSKAVVRQEVVAQREATRQPTGQMGGNRVSRDVGIRDGIGRTVAMVGQTTIN